jgi:ABC-type nitrate/sulfonate/bicarbonate transport system substrate-binding protein
MGPVVLRHRLVIGAVVAALAGSGCGAAATPTPIGPLTFHMQLTPSHVSAAIAIDQGFFTRVKPTYTLVGYGESSQLFHAGTDPIGNESPWEAAVYLDQGKDIRYFSTAEASNALQGIIIRAEDATKYKTLADLKGQKVGIPGFGTGIWAALQVVTKAFFNLDATKDFQIVEGNPGDLEGLLQTKQVEAMITFTAPTAHALANPAYKMLYSITEEWYKAKGAYLPANGWEAEASFLDRNLEAMKDFVAGVQKGLEYLKAHPEINKKGAKYENFAQGEGVLISPETTILVDKMIQDGLFYLADTHYTQQWIDSVYEFIQLGDGVLLPKGKVPPKEKVFYLPLLHQ